MSQRPFHSDGSWWEVLYGSFFKNQHERGEFGSRIKNIKVLCGQCSKELIFRHSATLSHEVFLGFFLCSNTPNTMDESSSDKSHSQTIKTSLKHNLHHKKVMTSNQEKLTSKSKSKNIFEFSISYFMEVVEFFHI